MTDYWDQMFERDPELLELMKANPGYIFEDSIESTSVSSYWSSSFLNDVDDGYAYKEILPAVAVSRYVTSGFMGVTVTDYFSFTGDNGIVDRIYEDYNDKLAEMYVKYRVSGITEWAKDTMGWGFRGQTFHLPGLEIARAAMTADIPECDNNAFPENSAMMGNSQGSRYKGEEKVLRNVTVTLAGTGVPYQLDPYTGKVGQIADYTAGDGTVTFTIDSIFGGTAMIYAVTGNQEKFDAAAGNKIVHIPEADPIDLSGEEWKLIIHSYGTDEDADDPGVSRITDVDFGKQPLAKWSDLPASEEQLEVLGVSDMKYVSGMGEYTLHFNAPAGRSGCDGAFIAYDYGRDQIGAVIVNGTELPANNAPDRVDAGSLISEGENEITIRLNSTLYGMTFAEHIGYQSGSAVYGMGPGIMDAPDPDAYYNGLLGVRIIPYIFGKDEALN